MRKFIVFGLLAAILCLSLSGCSRKQVAETEEEIILPEPTASEENMIMGEHIASEPTSVTLYYVSGDGASFSTVTRSLTASVSENIYAVAVESLLSGTSSPDRMSFVNQGIQVLSADYACGIVTVNLSLDALGLQNEQEYLMLTTSIGNTLLSMDGVQGVNVLVAGRSISVEALPTGVQTEISSAVTPAYAQFSAEQDYFLESETGTISRTAVLYFPSADGDWLIPELREITFESSDYVSGLISALRSGSAENDLTTTAIPTSTDLLSEDPAITITSSGETVLQVHFASTLHSYLALIGMDEWQMVGSVAMTLCSFMPDLDAVQISIGDEPITSCTIDDRIIEFEDGLIRFEDFSSFVGSTVTICLPSETGSLGEVDCAVSMLRAQSPLSILRTLFDEILELDFENDFFEDGIGYDDILGISIDNGVASVNLSANFYRQAQVLDSSSERCLVYAIVNTLCEMDDISSVQFYIEGISAETLSGSIYLKAELLPNPGLVESEDQDSDTAS